MQYDLDGDLTPRRQNALKEHIASCSNCSTIWRQLSVMQSAMQSMVGEPAPPLFLASPAPKSRWRAGVAVAAVVGLFIGVYMTASSLRTDAPDAPVIAQNLIEPATPSIPIAANARPRVQVEFDPAEDVIAVPMPTDTPNVTIIWLYPAVKLARSVNTADSDRPPS